jgi:IS30 family transposase
MSLRADSRLAVASNGLLRQNQYLPKGTDLGVYSQEQLDAIADSLNTRPRATHGFQSPLVVFGRMLALTHPSSTSTH